MRNPNYAGLDGVLRLLENVKQSGSQYTARCPAHDDQHSSLTVTMGRGRVLVRCHAGDGCTFKAIAAALNVPPENFFEEGRFSKYYKAEVELDHKPGGKWEARIERVYPYVDAEGTLLFEVVRLRDPKDFRVRRPTERGGYVWNLQGVTRVLYRLPQVIAAVAAGRPIYVCEGEKDVETLERWGLTATTAPGGAEKWDASFNRVLVGAQLVILPDNDEKGRRHVVKAAIQLHGKAESIRILDLPDLPEKGDVSEWVKSGGTFDEFERLVNALQPWTPSPQDGLPEIVTTDRPLRDVARDAVNALERSNTPPSLFVRAGSLVRIKVDEKGRPIVDPIALPHVRGYLTRAADFITITRSGPRHGSPPDHVVADVLSMGGWPMPPLENITETPVLRPDGTILDTPGYDPATQLYYVPAKGFSFPPVPLKPTKQHVVAALDLLNQAIGEFPYEDEASRANSRGLLITPTLRSAITGPVPLALLDAPAPGTGKSLLAELISLTTTGRLAAMMSAPGTDEEWRKRLTATFREGSAIITIDNVDDILYSPALAIALTASIWKDRILGSSTMFEFPINCTWMATGNNISPIGDLARRCYRIRLDAKMARPWQRTDFRTPNVRKWAAEHRGELVAALLTLARYWFVQGCPEVDVPVMGSFESWSRLVGNVLAAAGVQGFLTNLNEMYEQVDSTASQWETFLIEWRNVYGTKSTRIAQVAADLRKTVRWPGSAFQPDETYRPLRDAIPEDVKVDVEGSEDSLKKKLGKAISRKVGVRYGEDELFICRGKKDGHSNAETWRVLTEAERRMEQIMEQAAA